jgi:hypothetical protein
LIVQRVRQALAALRFAHDDGLEPGRPPKESITLTAQSPTEAADQHARGEPAAAAKSTTRNRRVYLVGFGKDAGVWAALARAAAPELVDAAAIDTGGFRFGSITETDAAAMLPGGAKYGDLPGFLALSTRPLWLAGEGKRPPPVLDAAYRAANASRSLTVARKARDATEGAAAKWLNRR